MIDFEGHLSFLVFLSGCNFRCGFCHNAALMAERQAGLSWKRVGDACIHLRQTAWITGVVISGGEPTLHAELPELIRFFKSQGLAVKLDTNGSQPGILEQLLPEVDAVAMDIKCRPDRYPDFVGWARPDAIRQSVQLLLRQDRVQVEFRTTVLPEIHTPEEMRAIGTLLTGARSYTLQPFHPRHDLPDPALRTRERTPKSLLLTLAEQLQREFALPVQVRG